MIQAIKVSDNNVKVSLFGSYADINSEIKALEVTIKDYKKSIKEMKED